jgi:hypothetical protein
MGLDIRLPIGGLFTFVGVLLVIYGMASDPAIYQRSLGINVNLIWGVVLVAFGVIMLLLGKRGAVAIRHRARSQPRSDNSPSHRQH